MLGLTLTLTLALTLTPTPAPAPTPTPTAVLSSPVPLVYTRHTARFLSAWLLLVPLALWEPFGTSWNHMSMVPATALLAIFLFGIEELAVQLEEPFSILPLQKLCDEVRSAAADLVA